MKTPLVVSGIALSFILLGFAAVFAMRWQSDRAREQELALSLEATRKAVREENERTAPQRLAAALAAQEAQQAEEDAQWAALDIAKCLEPKSAKDCDGVQAFIAKNPNSNHLTEAQKVMEDAQPKLKPLIERADWNAAGVSFCRAPISDSACDGVEEYIKAYPDGTFIKEARAMLEAARPKMERMKAAEKQKRVAFAAAYGPRMRGEAHATGEAGMVLQFKSGSIHDCKVTKDSAWIWRDGAGREAKALGFSSIQVVCPRVSRACVISLTDTDRAPDCYLL